MRLATVLRLRTKFPFWLFPQMWLKPFPAFLPLSVSVSVRQTDRTRSGVSYLGGVPVQTSSALPQDASGIGPHRYGVGNPARCRPCSGRQPLRLAPISGATSIMRLTSAIRLQSVFWFKVAFRCLRCHPMLCKSLRVRFGVDSIPSALTILSITCQLSGNVRRLIF